MNLNRIRSRLKGFFFIFRLHLFIPSTYLNFLGQLGKLSKWIHQHRKIDFSDFYSGRFDYNKRYQLYSYVIEKEIGNSPIDYFEFGVSKGVSFRWWAGKIKTESSRFHGFDTFTGLPEDWGSFKKGDMDNNNAIPQLDDPRCRFYQGLFQQTLPAFLKDYIPGENKKVILMDADLYSSTLFVLTTISHTLKKGDIIIFDEFNVPMHEFKAFSEWVASFYIRYAVIGSVNNFYQVAIRIV